MMTAFWFCFIPLFVATDAVGSLPFYIGLTGKLERKRLRRITLRSVVTGIIVALVFLLIGNKILKFLGMAMSDFMVAGGVILFIFSIIDLMNLSNQGNADVQGEDFGVVPLTVPYMVGPAVLTTGLLLIGQYGFVLTTTALVINMVLNGATLWFAGGISRMLGHTVSLVLSKLASLLLAAYGVMMVRRGLEMLIR
jgi:multiple antibiotic resistance protein